MRTMGVDIETRSSVDLSTSGVHRYAEAPDFRVIIICYRLDGVYHQIDTHAIDDPVTDPSLDEFRRALRDPDILKTAYNAAFERTCLAAWLREPMPPEQWSCTMVKALTLGLPGSLADVGAALGLPEDKLKDPKGKQLIRRFSVPRPDGSFNAPEDDPDRWEAYLAYNKQDVVTEQEITDRLAKYETTDKERRLWCLDQTLNDRGVRVDVDMARGIVAYDTRRKAELLQEAKDLTGLSNPNSLTQLKAWTASQGYEMTSITKDSIEDALADKDIPDSVRRALEIRRATGKASVAKYSAIINSACSDGRIRGILQFYGANRSGRWAGRLVQTHNLARNTLPDLDLARELAEEGRFDEIRTLFGEPAFIFSELVRTAFIPSAGHTFAVSDFSAIEARVLAWLSGEEWVLDAFRAGEDIYCVTASNMYGVPVGKHGPNEDLRAKGKVAVLACGYQGGIGAMRRMDAKGVIPAEELQAAVDQWRAANPHTVRLWRTAENAAKTALKERRIVRINRGIEFTCKDNILFIRLPSGRKLAYWDARIKVDPRTGREQITYAGTNPETHKWQRADTYGGKIVENITQAVARDCLAEAMLRTAEQGYKIVMHVHDEMIVDIPGGAEEAKAALDVINANMAAEIDWAPGLPLKGAGSVMRFYQKD